MHDQIHHLRAGRLLHAGDMSQNIYLQPDDFVYVPSALANEVYVLGAVKTPRAMSYQEGMSLVSVQGCTPVGAQSACSTLEVVSLSPSSYWNRRPARMV